MLKKLIVFAITSGLAARLYKAYACKKEAGGRWPATANARPRPGSRPARPHSARMSEGSE
jgi:hypothetical protein